MKQSEPQIQPISGAMTPEFAEIFAKVVVREMRRADAIDVFIRTYPDLAKKYGITYAKNTR